MAGTRRGGRDEAGQRETLDGVYVLVVDDDREARELLRTALEYRGALVTVAESAGAALAAIRRVVPDVIVCDIVMRDRDGYWLLRALRESPEAAHVPVIAVTGFGVSHPGEAALVAGFDAYFAKPIRPSELCRVVAGLARPRG